jgi:hypothetical protein
MLCVIMLNVIMLSVIYAEFCVVYTQHNSKNATFSTAFFRVSFLFSVTFKTIMVTVIIPNVVVPIERPFKNFFLMILGGKLS